MSMSHSDTKVTVDFMHWLAGFIAGEGCFLARVNDRGHLNVGFSIQLRNDDTNVLNEIKETLGFGRICHRVTRRAVSYDIQDIKGCLEFATLLQSYPLRAKKQQCFDVWSTLVIMKAMGVETGSADLVAELREGKQHDEDKKRPTN